MLLDPGEQPAAEAGALRVGVDGDGVQPEVVGRGDQHQDPVDGVAGDADPAGRHVRRVVGLHRRRHETDPFDVVVVGRVGHRLDPRDVRGTGRAWGAPRAPGARGVGSVGHAVTLRRRPTSLFSKGQASSTAITM
ncbi:hypothetical protein SAMN05444921_114215 [Streptomyces wuyuanensis]|uniref:Uncharacterized protein n=1 Tax=Streptomyces wuyuanensis TaxID=1196353 RepID=A0A1G9WVW1_9ACTN|nr:hypothetical protein SAMN05444921_114215 [Streptomyces wuyuanensis]